MNPSNRLVGMVHAPPLPGTPHSRHSHQETCRIAVAEAVKLADAGFECLLLENMHDRPYLPRRVGPEIVASMTAIALAIREATALPLGIQILAGANREALAVAQAAGCEFIRAEGFVFSHVADEGLINGDAGDLLRYRKQIGAESIRVFVDIKKKHSSHALTSDVSLAETAHAAAFFSADGVIVTGTATGVETSPGDLEEVRGAVSLPVLVGSGVTPENLPRIWSLADLFIVGSHLKEDGKWHNSVDPERARAIVALARRLADESPAPSNQTGR